jgi:hypothetical protein
METSTARAIHDPAATFYVDALRKLGETGIPFLLGGAFAFSHYSKVPRDTKDIDVFVRPDDFPRVLDAFSQAGYETEIPFPHWLGKIRQGPHFMDVIFASGNGVARVDDLWFDHAPRADMLGMIVRLSPAEEMIWSKAFIQERERFDGADVLHLLRETELLRRVSVSRTNLTNDVCYGTLLSREQYLHDIERTKYRDGRIDTGSMTPKQIEIWTAAISDQDKR